MLHVGSTTPQPSNKAANGQQGLIVTSVSYLSLGCCRAAAALSISFELQFLFFRVHVNVTQLLASLHVVPTPSCVEMAFEVLLFCLRCFVFVKKTILPFSALVQSTLAHSHLHTSCAAQDDHSWAVLCMSTILKPHAFGIHLLRRRTGFVFRPPLTSPAPLRVTQFRIFQEFTGLHTLYPLSTLNTIQLL